MSIPVGATPLLVLLLLHQPQRLSAAPATQPFPPPTSSLWGQPGWDDRRSFCTASSVPLQAPALQWSSPYNSSWRPSGPLVVDSSGNIFSLLVSVSPPWQFYVSRWSAADGRQEAGPLLCAGGSVQPLVLAGGCVVSTCGTYNSARGSWAYEVVSVFPTTEPSGCTLQLPWRPPQSDTLLLGNGPPILGVDSSCQALLVQLQYTTGGYTLVNTQLWRLDSAGGAPTLLAELCPTPPPLTPSCNVLQAVLSRGTLFLLCDIGLLALDMAGQPPLQPPVMVQAGPTCFGPLVASTEGTVFCCSREEGGGSGGQLLGFSATGPLPLPAVQVGTYLTLGPGPEALIVTLYNSTTLLGLSQQGQLVWSTPLPDDSGLYAGIVGQDGTVVLLLSSRAGLLAYSAASGVLLWRNSSVVAPVNCLAATIGLSSVVLLNYSSKTISLLASGAEAASASASASASPLPSPSTSTSGTPSGPKGTSPSSAPAASPGSSALSPLLLMAAVGVGGALLLGAAALYFYSTFRAQQPDPPSRFLAQGVGEDGAELDPAEYGALN